MPSSERTGDGREGHLSAVAANEADGWANVMVTMRTRVCTAAGKAMSLGPCSSECEVQSMLQLGGGVGDGIRNATGDGRGEEWNGLDWRRRRANGEVEREEPRWVV